MTPLRGRCRISGTTFWPSARPLWAYGELMWASSSADYWITSESL
jgi:hypothetical protein